MPTERKDHVPQAPAEAPDLARAFRAEQQSQEPTVASGADATDAEPSPSRPGRKPGDPLVRTP